MSLDYKAIGKHIREARRRNHLSQAMLAEAVDKTPSYISYIESGVSPERLLMEQITDTERCASEEITLLLSDCTICEALILLDMMKALKTALREHREKCIDSDASDFTFLL